MTRPDRPEDPLCAYCQMPKSIHCKGNVDHTDDRKAHHVTVRCKTRHCLAPLCDCLDYVEPEYGSEERQR